MDAGKEEVGSANEVVGAMPEELFPAGTDFYECQVGPLFEVDARDQVEQILPSLPVGSGSPLFVGGFGRFGFHSEGPATPVRQSMG